MINKFSKKLFQYYLPVTLTLFMLFTEKRTVTVDDGGYDRLFGFPLPYISNNFGCTGCYDVYVIALLIDFSIYFMFIFFVFSWIEKLGLTLKFYWVPFTIGFLISAMWIGWFYLTTIDSRLKSLNDIDYKTTYWELVFSSSPGPR